MAFLRSYLTVLLYAIQIIAFLFVAVALLMFLLSLFDISLRLGWGYNWWAPLAAVAQIAIRLRVRPIAAMVLKRIR